MTIPGSNRKIIILVEQDAASREALGQTLMGDGFTVLSFPDYRGALNAAESDDRIDLLITGLRLPAGTPHGLALAAMIRMRRPQLPTIFTADREDVERLAGEGSAVLEKPFEAAALIRVVTRLIGKPSCEAAP
ncbi:MAG TPA: response regulator [Aliidongia sp.]|nr:response regulator [Aliidongia sp.]